MNFFARQEAARRKTRVLLVYYAAAVFTIVFALYVASRALFWMMVNGDGGRERRVSLIVEDDRRFTVAEWDGAWFLWVAGLTLVVVGGATLWRRATLAEGGAAVARSAGGREITAQSKGFHERRLMNVVEEMALASGMPIPRVFVLDDEPGLNAFAAGFSPNDAAVAVTRAAMEQLSRDELQGVVGHEFSHIANGDMRLNSWLLGVLFGILCLSVTGRELLRFVGRCRPRSNSKGGGGAMLFVLGCGLALWGIGCIGVFFARLIQCSVTREREYLADASSVQFTRNPQGLANALKRIGATPLRNTLRCANRDELTHLLLASGSGLGLEALFASHPPIRERVRHLDPSFDGDFKPWRIKALTFEDVRNTPEQTAAREEQLVAGLVGGELAGAAGFLRSMDDELRRTVAHPADAAGVLYGLLLSDKEETRKRQLGRVLALEGQRMVNAALGWQRRLKEEDRRVRRMVAELAVEGVRQRDPGARAMCVRVARELTDADGEVSLFEYMLERRVEARLAPTGAHRGMAAQAALTAGQAQMEASLVLGALAYAGQPDDDGLARAAWQAGSARMAAFRLGELVPVRESCTLEAFDRALSRLAGLRPASKAELVAGCEAVVGADGQWTADETELLQAVCDLLGVPGLTG